MKIPSWIKIKDFDKEKYQKMLFLLKKYKINTVCIEANCPNRYECFSGGTATFLILGDICTRNCLYCNIKKGKPKPLDKEEPKRIAKIVEKLNLDYVVITCVTRDDLEDYGVGQFVETVKEIKNLNKKCKIELLISDLGGKWKYLKKLLACKPNVINHNIEVVKTLFGSLRPKGNYLLSLELLKRVKEEEKYIITKSGFMVGLGENLKEVYQTIADLKKVKCDIVTIGQYLQPSKKHYPVKKFYSPHEFNLIKKYANNLGFKKVVCGPLVRSSYKASSYFC